MSDVDALQTELDSALRHIALLITGDNSFDETAWWMCANHAGFLLDHPNIDVDNVVMRAATRAGTAPDDRDWTQWFARVAKHRERLNDG